MPILLDKDHIFPEVYAELKFTCVGAVKLQMSKGHPVGKKY